MTYLIGELLGLLAVTLLVGGLIGVLAGRQWFSRGRFDAEQAAADREHVDELEAVLADRGAAISAMRSRLAKREHELTEAKREIADLKSETVNTTGMESELLVAQEEAAKVSALQAEVRRLRSLASPAGQQTEDVGAASALVASAVAAVDEPRTDRSEVGDDLTRIPGVDDQAAQLLRERGVHTFEDLANLSPSELAHLDASLGPYAGRAISERWVAGAADIVAESRGLTT